MTFPFSKWARRASPAWTRFLLFLSIMGPGLITANVDNDAGGITTYSQAGAHFGLATLWIFIPMTIVLIMIQEMSNRMGVVTGKGLSDLIRETFGVRWTFYLMMALLVTNFGNVVAEFSGIAAAGELFGISKWISVPIAAILVWALVLKASYKMIERVFLIAVVFYVAYVIAGVQAKPDWESVGMALVTPTLSGDREYLLMIIGLIGTTIAPWMQFYQQASVVEKEIPLKHYKYSRIDTIVGGIAVSVVALFIVIVCAQTIYPTGVKIEEAAQAAQALGPLAGEFSALLFGFGLLNASLFAASILPMSTSYTICEAMGWESGVDYKWSEAKQFYAIYTALIVLGALFVLLPGLPLIRVMFLSQVVNGVLLPFVLVPMLIMVNREHLMGKYVNGTLYNVICWAMVVVLSGLSLVYFGSLLM
ncbi:MAG: Nramp family divalent metal transporter [Calditrichaeota bacterium]|nr:Nramp family divalent metal transporter [Calditrichota bacterium]